VTEKLAAEGLVATGARGRVLLVLGRRRRAEAETRTDAESIYHMMEHSSRRRAEHHDGGRRSPRMYAGYTVVDTRAPVYGVPITRRLLQAGPLFNGKALC
jgi:hypothetical protein